VVDRIRQAVGWALAVPVLWVSTVVYPVIGLGYFLVLGVVDNAIAAAILWILLFSVHLKWFSAGGFPGWDEGVLAGIKAL